MSLKKKKGRKRRKEVGVVREGRGGRKRRKEGGIMQKRKERRRKRKRMSVIRAHTVIYPSVSRLL